MEDAQNEEVNSRQLKVEQKQGSILPFLCGREVEVRPGFTGDRRRQ
jgi:hypothetical protein